MFLTISCGGNQNSSSENTAEAAKIRVAYLADFAGTSAAAIAQEKGFFTDEGLEVELVKFFEWTF